MSAIIHKPWNNALFCYISVQWFGILVLFWSFLMKKLFVLPIIWLVLGAVAIATEIKTTDIVRTWQQLSGVVVSCVRNALDKRESAVISALTTYQTSGLYILTARKTALINAWNEPTKSKITTAVSAAWKTYRSSMSALKSTLHTARDTAWSLYKTEIKSCKWNVLVQNVDTSSEKSEQ